MRIQAILLFCLTALMSAAQTMETPPTTDAQRQAVAKEIRSIMADMREAGKNLNEKSFNKYMDLWLDTGDAAWEGKPALFVSRLRVIPTKEEIDKIWRPVMAARQSEVQESVDDSVAVLSPSHAVYFFTAKDVITTAKGKTENNIAATVVFVKKAGAWKMLHYHQSWEPVPVKKPEEIKKEN